MKLDRLIFIASVLTIVGYVIVAAIGEFLAPYDPFAFETIGAQPPSSDYLMGTTYLGEDVLSQLLIGARVSVVVGLLSATLATLIGTAVGMTAGYLGGKTDSFAMRVVDFFYGLPLEAVIMVLVAVLRPSLLSIVLAISVILWRGPARVIRSQVLSVRQAGYVRAAQNAGASSFYVIRRHITPAIAGLAAVYFAIAAGWAIVTEATISFLGFGDPEQLSWGRMLNVAFESGGVTTGAWWWLIPPGIAITLLVLSVFQVGDWLDERISMRTERALHLT